MAPLASIARDAARRAAAASAAAAYAIAAAVAAVGVTGAVCQAAADACYLARYASARASEALTSSLPDGQPSGAAAVDADTMDAEAAFAWWTPSVLLCRAEQALRVALGRLPARRGPAQGAAAGGDELPPRMSALLGAAERRLGAARTVYVFDHGPVGVRLAARRTHWAVPDVEALKAGGAGGARRKPSVLGAYLGERCVTGAVGRVTNLPHPSSVVQGDGYAVTAREAVMAAVAASGAPVEAGVLVVAPRGSPVLAY